MNIIKGATAVNSKFSISFNKYDDGHIWITVTNHEGKTCRQPYAFITRDELTDLRDKINAMLEVEP